MLYRRFGFLQARLLLYKQDELCELESHLDQIDDADAINSPEVLQSRRNDHKSDHRKNRLSTIEAKFKEYGRVSIFRSICR